MERQFVVSSRLRSWLGSTIFNPLYVARRTLRAALSTAAPEVVGHTLDLGCGGKRYAALFPQATRYVFLDLPSNSASERAVSVWGDGQALPFADASFDSVLCTEVLEHVRVPTSLMREAYRVLK